MKEKRSRVKSLRMKTALIIYWSKTGNAEKVANAIKQGIEESDIRATAKKHEEAERLQVIKYDLRHIGYIINSVGGRLG